MIEACAFGDVGERQFGLKEEFHGPLEAGTENLFMGRAAQDSAKSPLEDTAGEANTPGQAADIQALAGVFANEAKGFGDVAVSNGKDVGGGARGNADRWNQQRFPRR